MDSSSTPPARHPTLVEVCSRAPRPSFLAEEDEELMAMLRIADQQFQEYVEHFNPNFDWNEAEQWAFHDEDSNQLPELAQPAPGVFNPMLLSPTLSLPPPNMRPFHSNQEFNPIRRNQSFPYSARQQLPYPRQQQYETSANQWRRGIEDNNFFGNHNNRGQRAGRHTTNPRYQKNSFYSNSTRTDNRRSSSTNNGFRGSTSNATNSNSNGRSYYRPYNNSNHCPGHVVHHQELPQNIRSDSGTSTSEINEPFGRAESYPSLAEASIARLTTLDGTAHHFY
ncbi:hypothetical protein QR680_018606 [Steinernema hermaphroditum]|uniref:Uncharacterized protein n=1 Tax=Steinernema hermaphroditum TaxID=289476 RepID=A0AA39HIH3_9BILA|nr:hypothetical protein QR680_018606 [Steinernema hermaphroditum]